MNETDNLVPFQRLNRDRSLTNLLIIRTPKAGTTALMRDLARSFTNYFAQSYDETMDSTIRAALSEQFSDLNADLYELLGFDIPEWCSSPVA